MFREALKSRKAEDLIQYISKSECVIDPKTLRKKTYLYRNKNHQHFTPHITKLDLGVDHIVYQN